MNIWIILVVVMITAGNLSWQNLLLLLIFGGAACLGSLYIFQEKMLYQPKIYSHISGPNDNPPGYKSPAEYDLHFENLYLKTSDGLRLHAWFLHPEDPTECLRRSTLLFFHANAGNMGFRLPNLKTLSTRMNLNILILSYRGYGESEGEPTEEGFIIDSETVYRYIQTRPDIVDLDKLFVFGRSLGGAVAISLVSTHDTKFCGLIVENTFTSISDLVDFLFPFLAYIKKWVLRLSWDSKTRIKNVTIPILFLSAIQDEVIPWYHMQNLYDTAVNSRKRTLKQFQLGHHNDLWSENGEDYINTMNSFISESVILSTD